MYHWFFYQSKIFTLGLKYAYTVGEGNRGYTRAESSTYMCKRDFLCQRHPSPDHFQSFIDRAVFVYCIDPPAFIIIFS